MHTQYLYDMHNAESVCDITYSSVWVFITYLLYCIFALKNLVLQTIGSLLPSYHTMCRILLRVLPERLGLCKNYHNHKTKGTLQTAGLYRFFKKAMF